MPKPRDVILHVDEVPAELKQDVNTYMDLSFQIAESTVSRRERLRESRLEAERSHPVSVSLQVCTKRFVRQPLFGLDRSDNAMLDVIERDTLWCWLVACATTPSFVY